MKKLALLTLALVAFASCKKGSTNPNEWDLIRIVTDSKDVTLVLDGKPTTAISDTVIVRDYYHSIFVDCKSECKIFVNGGIMYSSGKIK